MGISDLLEKDEIDILLNKAQQDNCDPAISLGTGDLELYDFSKHASKTISDLTRLETIDELFCREVNTKVSHFLCRKVEFEFQPIEVVSFEEYIKSLSKPTMINFITTKPLAGIMLISFNPDMVSKIIEALFGGDVNNPSPEGRNFGQVELQVSKLLLNTFIETMKMSWSIIDKYDFKVIKTETNPNMVSLVKPHENVIVNKYKIVLDQVECEFSTCIPCNMLEPIAHLLVEEDEDSSTEAEQAQWNKKLRQNVDSVNIDLSAIMAITPIKLAELLKLNVGDVIPINSPKYADIYAGNVKLFNAKCGTRNSNRAVMFTNRVEE